MTRATCPTDTPFFMSSSRRSDATSNPPVTAMQPLSASSRQRLKTRQAIAITGNRFPIEQERTHLECAGSLGNQREASGPVVAIAGQQPDASRIPMHHHAEAIVLDLMHPARTAWWAVGR